MPPGINQTTKEAAGAIAANKLASDPKTAQLEDYVVDMAGGDGAIHTMYGVKVDNTDSWIKAGPRGPMTLDDQHGECLHTESLISHLLRACYLALYDCRTREDSCVRVEGSICHISSHEADFFPTTGSIMVCLLEMEARRAMFLTPVCVYRACPRTRRACSWSCSS